MICAAALGVLGLPAVATAASDYPEKLIKIVVPVQPGFTTDAVARIVAEKLQLKFGKAVVVENRAGGAGGNVGTESVARAAPDGYTLLVAAPGPLAINKFLYPKLAFDPTEFVPISLLASAVNVLVVRTDSPIKSVRDLITYAKANPGKLSYASGGAGTTQHLASELLKSQGGGLDIFHVPYKGAAPAMQGFLQGQGDIMFAELGSTLPQIKTGRLRAIAVGGTSRSPSLPDVPTLSETLPGFVTTAWYGLVAPPKTPPAIASMLSAAVAEIVKDPDVNSKLRNMNLQPAGSTPAELASLVREEGERWGKVIRAAKITIE
jgi:tripartite-type tricarboxylate transporter receptor subunit TctC